MDNICGKYVLAMINSIEKNSHLIQTKSWAKVFVVVNEFRHRKCEQFKQKNGEKNSKHILYKYMINPWYTTHKIREIISE